MTKLPETAPAVPPIFTPEQLLAQQKMMVDCANGITEDKLPYVPYTPAMPQHVLDKAAKALGNPGGGTSLPNNKPNVSDTPAAAR